MRALKIVGILCVIYAGVVVTFESLLGYFQPENEGTLVITTTDDDGDEHERVVSRLESDGKIYVAANHWPRIWYYEALENPNVEVAFDGDKNEYVARPVSDEEYERVDDEHSLGLVFRILTGFPPRYFLRLEPRSQG